MVGWSLPPVPCNQAGENSTTEITHSYNKNGPQNPIDHPSGWNPNFLAWPPRSWRAPAALRSSPSVPSPSSSWPRLRNSFGWTTQLRQAVPTPLHFSPGQFLLLLHSFSSHFRRRFHPRPPLSPWQWLPVPLEASRAPVLCISMALLACDDCPMSCPHPTWGAVPHPKPRGDSRSCDSPFIPVIQPLNK